MQEYSVNNCCHAGGSLDLLLGISFMYFIYFSAFAFSLAFAILICLLMEFALQLSSSGSLLPADTS